MQKIKLITLIILLVSSFSNSTENSSLKRKNNFQGNKPYKKRKTNYNTIRDAFIAGDIDLIKQLFNEVIKTYDVDSRLQSIETLKIKAEKDLAEVHPLFTEILGIPKHYRANLIKQKAKMIHLASYLGALNLIKKWYVENPNVINIKDNHGNLPIHHASNNGHLQLIKHFIYLDKNLVYAKNNTGDLPIHDAANNGYDNTVKYFISLDKDLIYAKNNYDDLPIHYAAWNGWTNTLRYFISLDHSLIYSKDNNEKLPIHDATRTKHFDTVEYLISINKELINIKDSFGNLPIRYAIKNNDTKLISYLISLKDHQERLLMSYSDIGDIDTVKDIVMSIDNNLVNVEDKNGKLPIHYAIEANDIDTIKYYISINPKILNTIHTTLNLNFTSELVLRFLLKHNARFNNLNHKIRKILNKTESIAIFQNTLDLQRLEPHCFNNTKTSNNITPLHWATCKCLPETVKNILTTTLITTTLILPIKRKYYLHNSRPTILDIDGETALSIANDRVKLFKSYALKLKNSSQEVPKDIVNTIKKYNYMANLIYLALKDKREQIKELYLNKNTEINPTSINLPNEVSDKVIEYLYGERPLLNQTKKL